MGADQGREGSTGAASPLASSDIQPGTVSEIAPNTDVESGDSNRVGSNVADSNNDGLIDRHIVKVMSRRGRDTNRLYLVSFDNPSKQHAWVQPSRVRAELLHEFFVEEADKTQKKKRFLAQAREIKLSHSYYTRSKAHMT